MKVMLSLSTPDFKRAKKLILDPASSPEFYKVDNCILEDMVLTCLKNEQSKPIQVRGREDRDLGQPLILEERRCI